MSDDDRRRRQFVPLATHFATANTGTQILERFGLEGLAVWACMIAAAKKSETQGTIIWLGETDAWTCLGLRGHQPHFTFEEFVKYLGRLKQTRTTRIGHEKHTTLTRFFDWNHAPRRAADANRKRSKRAQNTADGTADDMSPLGRIEQTQTQTHKPPTPFSRKSGPTRNGSHSDLACPQCGVHCRTVGELEDHLTYVHPDPPAHPRWQDELVDAGELDRLNQLYGDTT